MLRRFALVVICLVGLAAVAVGVYAITSPSGSRTAALRDAGPESAPPAPSILRPPGGISELLKQLELVTPSREKLAPEFTVDLLGGSSFHLAEQRGKMVVVNFWATWCPPCREEMPAMERLWQKHKDKGLVMLAVSLDANSAVVAPFVKQHGFTFPIGLDPRQQVGEVYGVRALPSTFVIDRHGNLAAVAIGPRAWDNAAAHALVDAMVRP